MIGRLGIDLCAGSGSDFGMEPSHSSLPIGVFDSGLGGLTVLRALKMKLPKESFLYLGDVARLPYGTKSQAVVRDYARQCLSFLLAQQVKAVVIACNTASAMALDVLDKESPVPVFGVIGPGARSAIGATQIKSVLVLGTGSTVRSEAYQRAFAILAPDIRLEARACPLLVSLAEEGWFDHPITRQVIEHYVSDVDWSRFDTVLLGCTHFPLLEPSFRRVLPASVQIAHGANLLAQDLKDCLAERNLQASESIPGSVKLFTTDRVGAGLALLGDWLSTTSEAQVVHFGP